MTHINWNRSMEIGIEAIDEQHKQLVQLINDFYTGIDLGSPKDRMLSLIEELKRYTVYHFEEEETFMRMMKYPDLDEHIEIHRSFIKQVSDFENRFKSGKLLLSLEVTNFIKNWIIKHIMAKDKEYADFYAKDE